MPRCGLIATVLAAVLLAASAGAGPKDNKDNEDRNDKGNGHSAAFKCPPGLAKKNPPCVPPGQVGKNRDNESDNERESDSDSDNGNRPQEVFAVGAPLPDGYVIMFDPLLYPFWPHAVYARHGNYLYLIDPATGNILSFAGHVTDWTWPWSAVDFANCPPGLAKKNPPCVPPGQAKKGMIIGEGPYRKGDHLPDGYEVILTPASQSGADDGLYVRLGDSLYRIDRNTGLVLDLIGTVANLLP